MRKQTQGWVRVYLGLEGTPAIMMSGSSLVVWDQAAWGHPCPVIGIEVTTIRKIH